MRYIKIFGFLFFLLSPSFVFAGGSTYSRYGMGDILLFGGSRSYAMGGTGISSIGSDFINQFNPAGLAKIVNPLLTGSFEMEHYASKDSTSSGTFNSFYFQSFVVAIPISVDDGIVLSLEATPYSRVGYAVKKTDNVGNNTTSLNSYYGSGGIMTLGLGVSYSVSDQLHSGGEDSKLLRKFRSICSSKLFRFDADQYKLRSIFLLQWNRRFFRSYLGTHRQFNRHSGS